MKNVLVNAFPTFPEEASGAAWPDDLAMDFVPTNAAAANDWMIRPYTCREARM